MSTASVAVIGIGRIGLPVAAALARAGHRVVAHDVRTEVADAVREAGARWCGEIGDAVGAADLVLTVLPGSPELDELVFGRAALLAQLAPGAVWVDFTSAAPDLGAALRAAAGALGVPYLDAPVGGGPDAARDGTLTLYVGGEAAVLERARPTLDAVASRIHHVGTAGSGYLVKLLINLLWFEQAAATGEVLVLARRAGLDLDLFSDVVSQSPAASDFMRDYLPRVLDGDVVPAFGLDRIVEELDSLVRTAKEQRVPFSLGSAVTDLHRSALDHFGPRDGELLALAYLAEQAGIRLER